MQEIPIADAPRRVRNFLAPTENIGASCKIGAITPGRIAQNPADLQNKIRRPADQLHRIREQIRALKAEEAAIRQGLVDGSLDLEGDEHRAVVTMVNNERIDLKAMRQHVEESIWSAYLIATPTTYVRLERRGAAPAPRDTR
jgi:hypothetical protein